MLRRGDVRSVHLCKRESTRGDGEKKIRQDRVEVRLKGSKGDQRRKGAVILYSSSEDHRGGGREKERVTAVGTYWRRCWETIEGC